MSDPHGTWERSDVRRRQARRRAGRRRLAAASLLAVVVLGAGAYGITQWRKPPPAPPPPPALVPVTFPEGFRATEMAAALAGKTRLSSDAYLGLAGPSARGAELAGRSQPTGLEGFLFPATYEIGTDTTEAFLVDRQIQAYQRTMAGINLGDAKKRKLTEYDVVIIASMIEREVKVPQERRLVAGVIYNRLKRGMRLDIDATVQYALGEWRPLTGADLKSSSPYNTRRFTGLPPGPICNPGRASLVAAAHPLTTDYLYYVARGDGTGRHRFAKTLEEFNRLQGTG